MPPSIALATPTPMNQMPSVVMKDGTLRRMWMTPLMKPTPAPTARTTSIATRPRSLPLAPFSTSIDRITAESVSTPSTERSIDPIRMMKVAPIPSTNGIIAAWLMRTKLPKLRKFGLMMLMITHSRTSTTTGAHDARRKRRGLAGMMSASAEVAGVRRVFTMPLLELDADRRTASGGSNRRRSCATRRGLNVCPRLGRSVVLDLPAGTAPDVVPVQLRLGLDVAVVERLGVFAR